MLVRVIYFFLPLGGDFAFPFSFGDLLLGGLFLPRDGDGDFRFPSAAFSGGGCCCMNFCLYSSLSL